MPNHITHRLIVTGPAEALAAFRARCIVPATDDPTQQVFDFNTVIPRPAIYDTITSGGTTELAAETVDPVKFRALYRSREVPALIHALRSPEWAEEQAKRAKKLTPDQLAEGARALDALEQHGYLDWYEWSIANWGTKWGAYDFKVISEDPTCYECRFQTAWSVPAPVFDALTKQYPTLQFEVFSFDEMGNYDAHGVYTNGSGDVAYQEPGTREGYRQAYGEDPPDDDDDDESEEDDRHGDHRD